MCLILFASQMNFWQRVKRYGFPSVTGMWDDMETDKWSQKGGVAVLCSWAHGTDPGGVLLLSPIDGSVTSNLGRISEGL